MAAYKVVAKEHVLHVWDAAAPFLHQAIEQSVKESSLEDVRQMTLEGVYTLWLIVSTEGGIEGAFCTFFVEYPQYKVCYGAYGGADSHSGVWAGAMTACQEWARQHDCKRFVVEGRKGWVKALKNEGFSLDCVKMGVYV